MRSEQAPGPAARHGTSITIYHYLYQYLSVEEPGRGRSQCPGSMALTAVCCFALQLSAMICCVIMNAEAAQRQEDSLYMWIDAHQARVLIGTLLLYSQGSRDVPTDQGTVIGPLLLELAGWNFYDQYTACLLITYCIYCRL